MQRSSSRRSLLPQAFTSYCGGLFYTHCGFSRGVFRAADARQLTEIVIPRMDAASIA
jgi:hypothetical protein